MSTSTRSMLELLLHAGPWEITPEDRPRILRAARHHVDNPRLSLSERQYIARVWLPREPQDQPDGDAA